MPDRSPATTGPAYTAAQRWVALLYGLTSHALFLASVAVMFISLYRGLNTGFMRAHGWAAVFIDALLVLQFAVGHSLLLSSSGRRWMARLAPLGLGRDLATTIFAGLASIQLLITFLFWSSSSILWVAPQGWLHTGLTISYVACWILLAKSMHDAGLDAQIGSIGWLSIWRGRKPACKPFTRTGMFRYSRQPIYLSFSLILWTAPVWTPDHLFVAVVWTAYCLIAPVAKEKRYLRYYGAAFERYQQRVPYWFPGGTGRSRPAGSAAPASKTDYEVAIVGAGPVGLLLGCLLGEKGFHVLIVDRRTELPAHSQAIGITPPSLQILRRLDLDTAFARQGVQIRDCHVHGHTGYLGCASFREIGSPYRHILSLPQKTNMALLTEKLAEFPSVTLSLGAEIGRIEQIAGESVTLHGRRDGQAFQASANWLIGCDGHRSRVRDLIHMRTHGGTYGCHFIMGDFADSGQFGSEAHLFFTADGAVESFPLPDGHRRWIVQTREATPETPPGFISDTIRRRAGIDLPARLQINQSSFSPRWLSCEQYHDGRVILCGDAAHLMSPIGGQGMNTGWADAEFVAEMLHMIERHGACPVRLLSAYDRCRRRAAATARRRAAAGMWLGTRTGVARSLLRDLFMRHFLFKGPLSAHVGPYFAMLTIPYNTVERAPPSLWQQPSAS